MAIMRHEPELGHGGLEPRPKHLIQQVRFGEDHVAAHPGMPGRQRQVSVMITRTRPLPTEDRAWA
ncbi:hypothetical protein JMJ55_27550 [Belnapia sp. T6]|uniref:Uncharacterized protein n=1 Tax=Belnapia mucosa TaxID=2804532 RepID=A0ABS1VBT5_9PROT|nr:hypothetical protein [Belnapia mucosa]MBL6459087.1 hypothetical protein [Belnapia mucosa]